MSNAILSKIKRLPLKNLDILLFLLAVGMGFYFNWETVNIILVAFLIFLLLRPMASQQLSYLVLGSILLIMLMMLLGKEKKAEELAVYAYFFLGMVAMMGIRELLSQKNS